MSIFKKVAKVRAAQARMIVARTAVTEPASALLARSERYPLITVGTAVGAGFVLGRLNVHPLRIPGLGSLLSGTAAEIVAQATRLIAEFASRESDADNGVDDDDAS
jgi:hypothetical protein